MNEDVSQSLDMVRRFEEHRGRVRALAYRMLGSAGALAEGARRPGGVRAGRGPRPPRRRPVRCSA
jgi:hypothetical protein